MESNVDLNSYLQQATERIRLLEEENSRYKREIETKNLIQLAQVAKPETFNGSSKHSVDHWLLEVEQFYQLCSMNDKNRVLFATSLLRTHAAKWWRTVVEKRQQTGQEPIKEWLEFKSILTKRFKTTDPAKTARARIKTLKQTNSVMEYIERFQQLIADTPTMAVEDLIEYFLDGLKTPLRVEVEMRGPTTLEDAVRTAEIFDNILHRQAQRGNQSRRFQPYPPYAFPANRPSDPMEIDTITQTKRLSEAEKQILLQKGCCFFCRQPGHVAKNCPQKGRTQSWTPSLKSKAQ